MKPGRHNAIWITPRLAIPATEVRFITSRSSGPGGQHVNKVETRVTLYFNIENSAALRTEEKARLYSRLAARIAADGTLRVTAGRHRSQLANRDEALSRFAALLRAAFAEVRPRKKTAPTFASQIERLAAKRRRGAVKRGRKPPVDDA